MEQDKVPQWNRIEFRNGTDTVRFVATGRSTFSWWPALREAPVDAR
jgi:hypothetical protein